MGDARRERWDAQARMVLDHLTSEWESRFELRQRLPEQVSDGDWSFVVDLLVRSGLVQRQGEKRARRYRLATRSGVDAPGRSRVAKQPASADPIVPIPIEGPIELIVIWYEDVPERAWRYVVEHVEGVRRCRTAGRLLVRGINVGLPRLRRELTRMVTLNDPLLYDGWSDFRGPARMGWIYHPVSDEGGKEIGGGSAARRPGR